MVGILVFELFSVELFLVSVPSLGGDEKFNPAEIIMHSNMITEQNIHFFFECFVIIPPSILAIVLIIFLSGNWIIMYFLILPTDLLNALANELNTIKHLIFINKI